MPDLWMDVDAALSEVPVNVLPLIDDTDFKTREESVVYNAAGMDLVWNFVTTAGVTTQTAVTPTTAGSYDWTHQGNGMYTIEIPASGGASINNDTEGFGWFTGYATGILPWRGPVIGFRASAINDALVDGGDLLDVNTSTIASGAISSTSIAANAISASKIASNAIGVSELATSAIDAIADQVWDEAMTDHEAAGSAGETITAILGDTSELQTNQGNWLTATSVDLNADQSGVTVGTVTDVTNQVSADITTISGDSSAADSLEAILDGTGATMTLDKLHIVANDGDGGLHIENSGGDGVKIESTGSNGAGLRIDGNGTASGIYILGGGTNGIAINANGQGNGSALRLRGGETSVGVLIIGRGENGHGVQIYSEDAGHGVYILSGGISGGAGDALRLEVVDNGHGIHALGGAATGGDGIHATAVADGDGMHLVAVGGGNKDLNATTTDSLEVNSAEISASAVDSILDEPVTESDYSSSWTSLTLRKILAAIFATMRNEVTQNRTTGLWTLRNDADDGDLSTGIDSDDGTTFTRGERS